MSRCGICGIELPNRLIRKHIIRHKLEIGRSRGLTIALSQRLSIAECIEKQEVMKVDDWKVYSKV